MNTANSGTDGRADVAGTLDSFRSTRIVHEMNSGLVAWQISRKLLTSCGECA
jgi:hypothetical protein